MHRHKLILDVCRVGAMSLLVLLGVAHPVRSDQGDGTVDNPIRDRVESVAALMFSRATGSFEALTPDGGKPSPQDFVRGFSADKDLAKFKEGLPRFEQFRTERGELILDPKRQNEVGVSKVTYYVVEEDLPLTELGLIFYVRQSRLVQQLNNVTKSLGSGFATSFVASAPIDGAQPQLRVMTEDKSPIRWVPGSIVTFSLLKWTFNGDDARYRLVQRNLQLAAREWERVCNVRLEYHGEYDNVPAGSAGPVNAEGRSLVTFVALQYPLGGAIARSFFPNDPVTNRFLMVEPDQYYTTTVDRVGVLRHELGHVLGFRHEHISPDAPVWTSTFCSESAARSVAITRYDRASVMHYPCTSAKDGPIAENLKLEITELDRQGARGVYGPPGEPATITANFKNFDPAP
jgi:hypothetical protein